MSKDVIYRQAAIDVLCSICGNDCDKSEFVYNGKQEDQVILCPEHYALTQLPSAQPERKKGRYSGMRRAIYEDDVIKLLDKGWKSGVYPVASNIHALPSAQPAPPEKYEYHYDHTDCIWYRPEARNRCPSTCAQYRDGWNDAMNYIYRDGNGYRPYRRGEQYGE